jgi:phage terminase Nu1 subunit (DNA packaging protein)
MATTVPLDTICKLLDLTPQRVNQLAKEGVIPKVERGRYELVPVVRAYIQYLRMGNLKRDLPEDDYTTHRMRLTRAKADIMEMERSQMEEKLIPTNDIETSWLEATANMRAKMLSLPTKAAAEVFSAESISEVKNILKEQIYEALAELSNVEIHVYNPIRASKSEDSSEEDLSESEAPT